MAAQGIEGRRMGDLSGICQGSGGQAQGILILKHRGAGGRGGRGLGMELNKRDPAIPTHAHTYRCMQAQICTCVHTRKHAHTYTCTHMHM